MEDRRNFLKGLAASSAGMFLLGAEAKSDEIIIEGKRELIGRSVSRRVPGVYHDYNQIWKNATLSMAKTLKNSPVVVLPPDHLTMSKVSRLLLSDNAGMHNLVASNVCFAMPAAECKKRIKGFDAAKDNVVLLNHKAEKIDSLKYDFSTCTTARKLAEVLQVFVKGKENKHLKAWAKRAKDKLGEKAPTVEKAVKDLDGDSFRTRRTAKKTIKENLHLAMPFVILSSLNTANSVEMKENIKEVINDHIDSGKCKFDGVNKSYPLHLRGKKMCGMARVGSDSAEFLNIFVA